MIDTQQVATGPGLVFDVSVAGEPAAPLVLLLHGFGVSRHLYDAQLPALAAAGFRAAAPNQRGYSPGARPDPMDFARYGIELLIADALALADALGHQGRFHLVGHDWGGSLAWEIAARHPERLGSLTMLSRPHPGAFARALAEDPGQPYRSRHHKAFLEADAVPRLLADDAAWLRTRHAAQGCRRRRRRSTWASSAIRPPWPRRSPGIAPAAPSTGRSVPSPCRRCSSGAMPTTRWGGWRPRAPGISSRHPINSRSCPASATTPRTSGRRWSTGCCWRTWPATRCD
ncbi:alpha/beta fold hydrolase [Paeniroseomonas aquatica]|uniref:alpha/beta fold hydrolase n=1 Tax=Paeniroseomonas aquatica TaxID=373043 RepID=UPI003623593D